jgi:hypothetical protein
MSITVTATGSGAFANGISLRILIFQNAAAAGSQPGGTGASTTAYDCAVTIAATGSYAVGACLAPSSKSLTAVSGTTMIDNIQDSTNNIRHGHFISTSTTSSTGSQTFGSSASYSTDGQSAAAEIKASGTLTRDTGAEPAVATSTSSSAATTASFTPPAGYLVVALITGLCTGCSVSDTSGMTWTALKQAGSSANGYVGIWAAQVPSGTSVTGVVAAATAAALAGSITAGATIAGPLPAATGAAPAGSVSAGATVAGPVATATGAAPAGSTVTGKSVAGPVATATGAALAGSVSAGAKVSGAVATATAAAAAGSVASAVPQFPGVPLGATVELLLNGTWVDVGDFISYTKQDISIVRGHADESTTANPGSGSLALDNTDARFSQVNPLGPYWEVLGRNVQARISIPEGASYLRIEDDNSSYAQTPDSAGISITTATDIQIDITLDNWRANQILAAKWADTGGNWTWLVALNEAGTLSFWWSSNGTGADAATSSVPVPIPPLGRQSLRVEYTSANGGVVFLTAPGISGPWTQLGTAYAFGTTITLYNSTAPLQLGYCTDAAEYFSAYTGIYGKIHAFNLLSGIGGTAKASPDFTSCDPDPQNTNPYFSDALGITSWSAYGTGTAIAWAPDDGYIGRGALALTTTGAAATPQAYAEDDPVTAGLTYQATAWVWTDSVGVTAQIGINWWQSGSNTGGVYPSAVTLLPGVWALLTASGAAISGADHGSMFVQMTGTPASGTELLISGAEFTQLTFADAQGNVWTPEGTAEICDRNYRCHMEAAGWTPVRETADKSVWMNVALAGLLRRIQQGTKPLQSTFRRALPSAAGLYGYWPCEDGNDMTGSGGTPGTPSQIASALPGGLPGSFQGTPDFASCSSFLCSYPVIQLNNSRLHFSLGAHATDSANIMRFLLSVPSGGDASDGAILAQLYTSGTVRRADLIYHTGGALELIGYDSGGNQLLDSGSFAFGINGVPIWISVELQQSGSNVQASIVSLAPGAASGNTTTPVTTAGTIGQGTTMALGASTTFSQTGAGQLTYQGTWQSLYDFAAQLDAYQGEAAAQRFVRLCGEQGIACRVAGSPDDTVAMGAQTPLSFMQLLQEAADADRGQIFEPRQVLALGYRTRASMQNQAAGWAFDYSGDDLTGTAIAATADDQYTVNDATVTRAYTSTGGTGSSSEVDVTSGPLSVLDPPDGVGDYLNAYTLNLSTDPQTQDSAGWISWIGTADPGPRYPKIHYDLALAGIGTALYQIPLLDLAGRLTVASTPPDLPPDGITGLIMQMTEALAEFGYTIDWVTVPETGYETMVWDDLVYGRFDTPASTVHASVSAAATSIQVDTTGDLWTTASGDFPVDIVISGERLTVTDITGTSSPQTFTVTRSVNGVVKPLPAGADVRLFCPPIWSL